MAAIALQFGLGAYSAFLQVLFDKLSSPLLQRFGYYFRLEDKLNSLELTLSKIYSLVGHAEMQIVSDPSLAIWLRELKNVARDAEDVLDDFVATAQSHYNIGKKIDELQKRLADIAEERRGLGSAYPTHQLQLQIREWRATTSLPTERHVFGRDTEKRNLTRLLLAHDASANSCAFSVLPIVGMGGIGKTTLARIVYNDPEVEHHFYHRIWVCVSNDFNVARITEELVIGAVSHERACSCSITTNLNKLQSDLQWKLSNKRFLLVLDDVWSENHHDWERLCAPLNFAAKGSKIVITTRSTKVADIMGTADPFFLDRLPESDCWDLFKACALVKNSNCDEHSRLQHIGRKIVKRLNGVPLAAKTIGGLLYSNKDEGAWVTILDCPLWKLSRYENDIMPVLRLSYQQMPNHLKLCFQFCSLFPKGYRLDKHQLVHLWVAQGFIQTLGKRQIEEIGGEYFDELVCRSVFQKVDNDYFLMHDLMHELAQSVSSDECVIIEDSTETIPQKVLHSSLHFDNSFELKDLYKHKSLRTLLFLKRNPGCNFSCVPKELFVNFGYMRALDLRHSNIVELPDLICLLKHLRYLDLSHTKIRSLPRAVGELCNLQTMLLINCNLAVLPDSMNKLINLRNFKGRAALLCGLPGIGKLEFLQELEKFEVSRAIECQVRELKRLSELRGRLHISKLENVTNGVEADEASLKNKQYLHTLELEWGGGRREDGADKEVLESLEPHPNLTTLKIRCNDGSDYPIWLFNERLPNLENVSLVKCQRWTVLPPLKQLASLKYLEIGKLTGVKNLPPEFWGDNGSPQLVELIICDMTELEIFGLDRFPTLQKLDISNCPKIRALPDLPPTLEVLNISNVGLNALPKLWGCNLISSSASSSTSSSSESSPSSSLSSVSISSCRELTSLQEGLFQYCHCALKTLSISNCEQLVSLPTECFSQLISLTFLIIENCPNLTSLPEGYGLPGSLETLKVLSYTQFITRNQPLLNLFHNLTSLSTLSISAIPNLISLSEDALKNLNALEILTITGCEELETLEIEVLTALKSFVVTRCPRLISLTNGKGLQTSIPLRSITLRDCVNLSSLPYLGNFSLLEDLSIRNCPMINSLPDLPDSVRRLDIV